MKVSFDFDGTLSRKDVQGFAKELINMGIDVWIVTSRTSTEDAKKKAWWWVEKQNDYLFEVANECGIPKEKIVFTGQVEKVVYLTDRDFVFHLDDDEYELIQIMDSKISCVPLNVGHFEWKESCLQLINKK